MISFKQFFTENVQGRVFYHVTKASNVPSILKSGLQPNKITTPGLKSKNARIYLFSNISPNNADMFKLFQHEIKSLGSFMSSAVTTAPSKYEDIAILKVTVPPTVRIYPDHTVNRNAANAFYITNKSIPPNDIEVVWTGPINQVSKAAADKQIIGDAYETRVIIPLHRVSDINEWVVQLIKDNNNTQASILPMSSTITVYQPVKPDRQAWAEKRIAENRADVDDMYDMVHGRFPLYPDSNGILAASGAENFRDYFTLGIDTKQFIDAAVKQFGAKIAHTNDELVELYWYFKQHSAR